MSEPIWVYAVVLIGMYLLIAGVLFLIAKTEGQFSLRRWLWQCAEKFFEYCIFTAIGAPMFFYALEMVNNPDAVTLNSLLKLGALMAGFLLIVIWSVLLIGRKMQGHRLVGQRDYRRGL